QRFDLLGKIVAIERFEAAVAKMPRLLHQPGIEVALVRGLDRLVGGREIGLDVLAMSGHVLSSAESIADLATQRGRTGASGERSRLPPPCGEGGVGVVR